ncbi:MAG: hypothetical protein NVS2B3_02210 [Vulcanimicrobiaceae bacterium]
MRDDDDRSSDEERAIRRYLLYFMLPFWMLPGLADWYLHKRTDIEGTSGTHESLTHQLMMGAIGGPILCGLFFEVNALVLAIMMGGYAVHEAISYWDVSYASGRRDVPAIEQQVHSFLEMLPFVGASLAICSKPRQFAAIFGRGSEAARWRFEAKRPALSRRYIATILGLVTAFVALPYAEEFARCYRVDRTLRPHDD